MPPTPSFIDTHVHLWDDPLPPWLSDPALATLARPRTIADNAADAGPQLVGAVYLEVDVAPGDRPREVAEITALCADASNPLKGAVIGAPVADGTVAEFEAYLAANATSPFVKGVRQVLHIQPTGTCVRPDVVAKARLCGERGLVFELCMRAEELSDVAALADAAPDTRLVLDHCGGHHQLVASAPEAKVAAWKEGITLLASKRNVWCKLSGLLGAQGGTEGASGAGGWTPAAQATTIGYCIEAFAPDRLIFGGDWPVCTLTAPLSAWSECCIALLDERLGAEGRERVLVRNAVEAYGLQM